MERAIKMISSASKSLHYLKNNPYAIDEEIFQYITDYISEESIKDEITKRAMIASASRAIELRKKHKNMTEKQILKIVMEEVPGIINNIDQ
ncbi:hypothetical protein J4221_04775 [Candidatus Pacearchaeota archaeon]|nr:hypothetical protein [Candidatus Pacearchaeota archaeon]